MSTQSNDVLPSQAIIERSFSPVLFSAGMEAITEKQWEAYFDSEEEHKRQGALFFRLPAGVRTRQEALSIPRDDLDSFLRASLRNAAESLMRRKSLAKDLVTGETSKALGNAFPQLTFGISCQANPNAKPRSAYTGEGATNLYYTKCYDVTADGQTLSVPHSVSLSWKYRADKADILDPTTVCPETVGNPAAPGLDPIEARDHGTQTARDVRYTNEGVKQVVAHAISATSGAYDAAIAIRINNVKALIELTLSLVSSYDGAGPSLSKMFPAVSPNAARHATSSRVVKKQHAHA